MIVYGDPQFEVPANSFVRELQLRAETFPTNIDELRTFLIRAGQLEQAASDVLSDQASANGADLERICRITDLAAEAFLSSIGFGIPNHGSKIICEELQQIKLPLEFRLNIKVPEGFEFYALFPEQYCASAKKWADTHSDARPRRVAVVGIRSIGTTLSAAVAAKLRMLGWETVRFTVRPHGHPFSRQVEVSRSLKGIPCALVVDEGPGISGSSMATVAATLADCGVPDVSLFPGHDGEPGAAASSETRKIWTQTPRYFTALEELHWNGKSLHAALAEQTMHVSKTKGPFDQVDDLSGGTWRRFAFSTETDWPPVAAQFERMKIRFTARNGAAVLWKFGGFGCATGGKRNSVASVLKRTKALAAQCFCPPILGTFRGFIAMPWIEGRRLTRLDAADSSVLRHIGRYLLYSAGPELAGTESEAAIDRLAEMLFWNTKNILGDDAAKLTRELADAARRNEMPLSYGDGHLAPHEWIRNAAGILKTDGFGHDCDHTMIGRQSLLWDIAGGMIEWELDEHTAHPLLEPVERSGIPLDFAALRFYRAAYAAFRMGLLRLAMDQTADAAEKKRLGAAVGYYRNHLQRLLERSSTPALTQTHAAPLPAVPLGACNPK